MMELLASKEGQLVMCEPSPKRVRVVFGGRTIADSQRTYLVRIGGTGCQYFPCYYYSRENVRTEFFRPSTYTFPNKYLGNPTYWNIVADGKTAENAVWVYPRLRHDNVDLSNYVAFEWDKMDAWFEESEEVFVHAHDPYHRIDVLQGSREVRVVAGGETIALSHSPVLLFETGLPVRYYLPKLDCRIDLLLPSNTITGCAYKGKAQYYSVKVGEKIYPDLAWYYNYPTTEVSKIAAKIAFFNERVDGLYVDGVEQPKPSTPWSR